jgi:uncharacterized membrane protein
MALIAGYPLGTPWIALSLACARMAGVCRNFRDLLFDDR